ncbi:MAG: alternative ribosome rescue aminoacyl-tRNA hydrolase ArfB [Alphaproteobacteria bacterium]|nr:alternative ribosome rescue aminoacyl-tRNA hydrolase ArfB [Alphaproteobacteria bacterium]
MIQVTANIFLSEDELEEHFIRAPGPGGQNVNKVATAVHLRFDAVNCPALSAGVLQRLRRLAGSRMTQAGIIILNASSHRSQERNRADAKDRLFAMIREAATPPKHRRATKPSLGAKRRRMDSKSKRGNLKKTRGSVGSHD